MRAELTREQIVSDLQRNHRLNEEWAERLTAAIEAPAGETTLADRRAFADRFGLVERNGACDRHANKIACLAAWRQEMARGLDPQAAEAELGRFLDGARLSSSRLEPALTEWLGLAPGEQRQLYQANLRRGFVAEWPMRFTAIQLQPNGESTRAQRTELLDELCRTPANQLHASKERVFDLIEQRQEQGLGWQQARDEVMGLVGDLDGLGYRFNESDPLLGQAYPLASAHRPQVVDLMRAGYSAEWVIKGLDKLSQEVPGTTFEQRSQALAAMAGPPLQLHVNKFACYDAAVARTRQGVEFDQAWRELRLLLDLGPRSDNPQPLLEQYLSLPHPTTDVRPLQELVHSLPYQQRAEVVQAYQRLVEHGLEPGLAAFQVGQMIKEKRPLNEQLEGLLRVGPGGGVRLGEDSVQVGGIRLPTRRFG